MGVTHLTAGTLMAAVITGVNPAAMAVGGIAALLPDIDEPNSKISKRIPMVPCIIGGLFGHRTITHSLTGLFLFALPVFLFWKEYLIVFLAGYLSHLVLDSFTKTGVPIGYPFIKEYYGPRLIRTGSLAEVVFFIFIVVGLIGIYRVGGIG